MSDGKVVNELDQTSLTAFEKRIKDLTNQLTIVTDNSRNKKKEVDLLKNMIDKEIKSPKGCDFKWNILNHQGFKSSSVYIIALKMRVKTTACNKNPNIVGQPDLSATLTIFPKRFTKYVDF